MLNNTSVDDLKKEIKNAKKVIDDSMSNLFRANDRIFQMIQVKHDLMGFKYYDVVNN